MSAAGTDHKVVVKELRSHSNEELGTLQKTLAEELFKFRMQRYTNQLENTMQIRKVRRDIARVKTILSARAIGLETQTEGGAEEGATETKAAAPARPAGKGTKKTKAKAKAKAKAKVKAKKPAAKAGAKKTKAKAARRGK